MREREEGVELCGQGRRRSRLMQDGFVDGQGRDGMVLDGPRCGFSVLLGSNEKGWRGITGMIWDGLM